MVPCTILSDFRHVPIVEIRFGDRGDLPKAPQGHFADCLHAVNRRKFRRDACLFTADGCCKQQFRTQIQHYRQSNQYQTMEKVAIFDVIDPSNPTGKVQTFEICFFQLMGNLLPRYANKPSTLQISVPSVNVSNTVGKTKYGKNLQKPVNKQKDFSICLLHHAGWCKLGVKCQQIHADPAFVNNLRQVAGGSNCCIGHGDQRSQEPTFTALVWICCSWHGLVKKHCILASVK